MRTDEGIEITEQGVSCLVAVVFLSIFIMIYAFNYQIQQRFEVEQNEIKNNQEYAKVAAYDGSTINGQDIVSFITTYRGSIPVIITGSSASTIVYCSDTTEYGALRGSSSYKLYRIKDDGNSLESTLGTLDSNTSEVLPYQEFENGKAKYDAATVIKNLQNRIKDYRHTSLGATDGLYGNWEATMWYEDSTCRLPGALVVKVVG